MRDRKRVAVLISGRGSNMKALVESARTYEVVLVASNRVDAAGLDWAREKGLVTWAHESRDTLKPEFEETLNQALDDHRIGTVALAGFMQILTAEFIQRWARRVINIHPSLLPKYRGLNTHRRALEAGDTVSGCTVHLVTEELDAGDNIAQAEVAILPGDTPETLERRILEAEHRLYPQALAQFVSRT